MSVKLFALGNNESRWQSDAQHNTPRRPYLHVYMIPFQYRIHTIKVKLISVVNSAILNVLLIEDSFIILTVKQNLNYPIPNRVSDMK